MRTRRKSWTEINRQRQAQIMANPFPVDTCRVCKQVKPCSRSQRLCSDCELITDCGPDCDQNKIDELQGK